MKPLGTSPRNVCVCRSCGNDDKADMSGRAREKRTAGERIKNTQANSSLPQKDDEKELSISEYAAGGQINAAFYASTENGL